MTFGLHPRFRLTIYAFRLARPKEAGAFEVQTITHEDYYRGTNMIPLTAKTIHVCVSPPFACTDAEFTEALEVLRREINGDAEAWRREFWRDNASWNQVGFWTTESELWDLYPRLRRLFDEQIEWIFMTRWLLPPPGERHSDAFHFEALREKTRCTRQRSLAWSSLAPSFPCQNYIRFLGRFLPDGHSLMVACARTLGSRISRKDLPHLPLPEELKTHLAAFLTTDQS